MTFDLAEMTEWRRSDDFASLRKSSIGRKWQMDGETRFHPKFDKITVVMTKGPETRDWVLLMAKYHELGHVLVAQDCHDDNNDSTPDRGFDTLRNYDGWQSEVEAWVRGWPEPGISIPMLNAYELALDCLNTYRRGLGISDNQWHQAREVMIGLLPDELHDQARLYVPLEPDPNDAPPNPCGKVSEGNDDEGSQPDNDPDSQAGQPSKDLPKPGQNHGPQDEWNREAVIDMLHKGYTPEEIADWFKPEIHLDVTRMSPLAKAMAGRES